MGKIPEGPPQQSPEQVGKVKISSWEPDLYEGLGHGYTKYLDPIGWNTVGLIILKTQLIGRSDSYHVLS